MPEPITTPATTEAITGKDALQVHYSGKALEAVVDSDKFVNAKWDRSELTVEVAPEAILATCQAVKDDGYNFFEDVTAVDWYPAEPRFQIAYSILSMGQKKRIRINARVSSDGPRIDSITSIWPAANFYEREVFDLFGIHFAGHPRLTRIMMPDNWNGHPLRKDYPVEGYR
jgi:NADH-quinone oxidoreductase subunit C